MQENYIITGIPRSGTSLFSSLISENSDSVVFSEPEWLKDIRASSEDCSMFSKLLNLELQQLRINISKNQSIKLKFNENQKLPTNYFERSKEGKIVTNKKERRVILNNCCTKFPFYIKSNAQFTSCLSTLIENKNINNIFCIIRNPISCIMSWRSLNIPVSQGNMYIAEKYSASYRNEVSHSVSLLHKQVQIIEWFYKAYFKHSSKVEIIKYEDLISSTNTIIKDVTNSENISIEKLSSQNKSQYYDSREKHTISEHLKKYGKYYKYFYPKV